MPTCALRPEKEFGLVGANGAGKSTLLKILIGEEEADHGEVDCAHLMSYCAQEPVFEGTTVKDVMDKALSWHHQLLSDFEQSSIEGDMDAMSEAQERLDLVGWDLHIGLTLCVPVSKPQQENRPAGGIEWWGAKASCIGPSPA